MISVIIVSHPKYVDRLGAVIESILRSTEKDIEIMICTDDAMRVENYLNKKVKVIEIKSNRFKNNLGFYRNIALKYSEGEYLYFTDADIIIYNQNYLTFLKRISKENGDSIVVWPNMYRLDEGVEQFCEDFNTGKKLKLSFDYKHCMYGYKSGNFYKILELRAEFDGVPHVCKPLDYNNFKKMKSKEFEELVWRPTIHWGGIFCRKDYFENIGGFSLEYFNWGCEDDDLIWKLSKMYNVIYLFKESPNLAVLHLEHPRKYWTYYKENMRIFARRKHKGVNSAISDDRKKYESIPNDTVLLLGGGNQ